MNFFETQLKIRVGNLVRVGSGSTHVKFLCSFTCFIMEFKRKNLIFFRAVRSVFSSKNQIYWHIELKVGKIRKCSFWMTMQNISPLINMSEMNEKWVIRVTIGKTQLKSKICKDQFNSFQPFTPVWGPNSTRFNSKVGSTGRVEL